MILAKHTTMVRTPRNDSTISISQAHLSIFETSVFSTKALEQTKELERELNRQTIRISNKKVILAVSSVVVILLATCIGDIRRKARAQ